ncbi:hypothetical protein [Nocardioides sp. GY 10127]|uniref:hypothetical protein n=1 Tax=Nocardioides sp. GY 10127 TaxID=2569762 RepID=UPI0010A93868|nr:hypothetical protein [Nocardioides sp. GY 10127]TIC78780.1 hypothetical protein E8D37_18975 [Nocardioides sp. GY 10127]
MAYSSPLEVDTSAAAGLLDGIIGRLDSADPLLGFLLDKLTDHEAQVFATRGFGAWPNLDPDTTREKGSSRVLVDTGGLLDALTDPSSRAYTRHGESLELDPPDPARYLAAGARGAPRRDPIPAPTPFTLTTWGSDLLDAIVSGQLL